MSGHFCNSNVSLMLNLISYCPLLKLKYEALMQYFILVVNEDPAQTIKRIHKS